MSSVEFDEETTAHHRTARFDFVPWMARTFGIGAIRGDSSPLPLNNAPSLTDETIEAIEVIANRASWKFLVHDCGWPRLEAVDPANPDVFSRRRLWEESLPALRFTTATPELLITVFNGTRNEASLGKSSIPDCIHSNGDLMVHHLIFRRLAETPRAFDLDQGQGLAPWLTNPLNAMVAPLCYLKKDSAQTRWDRLCDSDLAPFVPWIGMRMASGWKVGELSAWSDSPERGLQWFERMTRLISDWTEMSVNRGQSDLIGGALDYLASQPSTMDQRLETFAGLNDQCPMWLRQRRTETWIGFLSLPRAFEAVAEQCAGIHPVERTGSEKCFLARWESHRYGESFKSLSDLSQTLRPSFN